MNLPQEAILHAKQALQANWSDTITITRNHKVGNVIDDVELYKDVPCHFSFGALPVLNQTETVATTTSVFTLYVDTEVIINTGDLLAITHKNQVFKGIAGQPFHGTFSNSLKVEVKSIS